jgi:hypothetical protein
MRTVVSTLLDEENSDKSSRCTSIRQGRIGEGGKYVQSGQDPMLAAAFRLAASWGTGVCRAAGDHTKSAWIIGNSLRELPYRRGMAPNPSRF